MPGGHRARRARRRRRGAPRGLRVLAHAHSVADYRVALAAGVDALMHSSFEPLDAEIVARVRDAGIPVCPTLWVFESACLGAEMRLDGDARYTRHVSRLRRSDRGVASPKRTQRRATSCRPGSRAASPRRAPARRCGSPRRTSWLLRDAGVPVAFGNDASYGFSLVARPDRRARRDAAGRDRRHGVPAGGDVRVGAPARVHRPRASLAEGRRADLLVVDARVRTDVTALDPPLEVIAAGERLTGGAASDLATRAAFVAGMARTALGLMRRR